jgi:hypothetical protein
VNEPRPLPEAEQEPPRDDLTGLPGLDAARARLAQWNEQGRHGGELVVHGLLLGLQRFETINMAFGEAAMARWWRWRHGSRSSPATSWTDRGWRRAVPAARS